MFWRRKAEFRAFYLISIIGVVLAAFGSVTSAEVKGGKIREAGQRPAPVRISNATSPPASQSSSASSAVPRPVFNSPAIFSVAGNNVGQSGMYSMVHADFNGDGIPDLASVGFYCARPSQGTAAIFLGKGDGTFNAPIYTPAGQCPGVIKTAKLRGPNAPNDLLVIDAFGNRLWMLLGNGDGTFAPPVQIDPGFGVNDATVGDFNEDGKPDLAIGIANLGAPVVIMLGNGDGTFQPGTPQSLAGAVSE